ncbi:MAG: alpha/beta hydrolase [Candidatus Omnitrophota bacterium]
MPFLRIENINWHYEICGEGEPVIFLHGWGGSSRIWNQQVEYFSREFKTITIDLPGHGKTDWQDVGLQGIAQGINALVGQLGLNKVNLVGNSVGGLIGVKMFELDPNLFKRSCFVDSLPKFLKSEDFPFGLDSKQIENLSAQVDSDYPAIVDIFFRSLFVREERQDGKLQWLMKFRKEDDLPQKGALKKILDILIEGDLRDVFKKINVPVLLVNGTDDYICSKDAVLFLNRILPSAKTTFINKSGHFPFLTRPQEFNKILEGFLKHDQS